MTWSGFEAECLGHACLEAKLEDHAVPARLAALIIIDARQRFTAGQRRVQTRRPADLGGCAEDRDRVATRGRNPRSLESRDTRADDRNPAPCFGARRPPIHLVREGYPRIVVARERLSLDDLPPARVAGHAVADLAFAPVRGFERPCRIGEERATETQELALLAREDAFGLRRIGDQTERDHRCTVHMRSQAADERHPCGPRPVHVRDVPVEGVCMGTLAECDIIHRAIDRDLPGDLCRLCSVDTIAQAVIARQLDADEKRIAAGRTDRRNALR